MNESERQAGDVTVEGLVAPGYEQVRDAFVGNFTRLGERGAAVAVYRDGRKVVDLWGGTRDGDAPAAGGEPWRRGTAQIVRSATKGIAATVLLLLHQRGGLDLEAPVATYWPEYKAHGKDGTRVRHVLGHRAGVPALDAPLDARGRPRPRPRGCRRRRAGPVLGAGAPTTATTRRRTASSPANSCAASPGARSAPGWPRTWSGPSASTCG